MRATACRPGPEFITLTFFESATMEQDEIQLIDLYRLLRRERAWLIAVFVLCLIGTAAFSWGVPRQWQATAWIQIGQVGQVPPVPDLKVESQARVLERLQMVPFQNEVLDGMGIGIDAPDAKLYRKSLTPVPLQDADLVRLLVRGSSPDEARHFAAATIEKLKAIHGPLESVPLTQAHARLDQTQTDLKAALSERDQLVSAVSTQANHETGDGNAHTMLMASGLLGTENEEIRVLQQKRSNLVDRLSTTYTYETSALGNIYVQAKPVYPNQVLVWITGLSLGLVLGALAALLRNAIRREAR
jgi:capsular polysaccharide biosynthesis protein